MAVSQASRVLLTDSDAVAALRIFQPLAKPSEVGCPVLRDLLLLLLLLHLPAAGPGCFMCQQGAAAGR